MNFLICDQFRMNDLRQSDTTADTPQKAREEAEKMAKKWGCKVHILQVVGEVEGVVEPRWTQEPDKPPIAGWFGMIP